METKFDEISFNQLFNDLNRLSLIIAELIANNKDFRNINLQSDLEKINDFPQLSEVIGYVDEEILSEVISNNSYPVKRNYFLNLLPFFSKETIVKIIARYEIIDVEILLAVIPFITESQLQEIINEAIKNQKITITSDLIDNLVPFVVDQDFLFNLK